MTSHSKHAKRPWDFRPRVEKLEIRTQPGSLLFTGLGAGLLGTALDQGTLPPDSSSDTSILALHRPTDQNTHAVPAVPLAGGSSSAAPGQVTGTVPTSSLPLSTGSADLGAAGQPAPTHVVPVGSLAAPVAANPVGLPNSGAAATKVSAASLTPAVVPGGVGPTVPVTVTPIQSQSLSWSQWSVENVNAIGSQVSSNWASFFGGPGANNALRKVVYTNASNGLVVGGYTQDPTDATKTDPTVALISRSGTTATIARYTGLPSGSRAEVHALAVGLDNGGNITAIYAGGYFNSGGGNTNFVASVNPSLTSLNWVKTALGGSGASVINGIALNTAGTDLFVTGQVGSSAIAGDLLTSTGATNAYLESFNGGTGTTDLGNAIGVDATGKADIALRHVDTTNNPFPSWVQVDAAGNVSAIQTLASTGDTAEVNDPTFQAGFNTVTVDSTGNAYYAGVSYGSFGSSDPYSLAIIEKVAPDGHSLLYMNNGQPVAWHWYLTNSAGQHVFNWGAFDNRIRNGDQALATTDDDGTETLGSHGELFFAVGPNGDVSTDFGDAGLSGINDDYGYGLAQDTFNSSTFYMVGKTNSPDFLTTAGTFQTHFNGNPPADYNGWVASLATTA